MSTGFVTGINPPQCASLPLPLHVYNNQFVCSFTGSQQTSSWGVDPPLNYGTESVAHEQKQKEKEEDVEEYDEHGLSNIHITINALCHQKYPRTGVSLSLVTL